MVSVIWGFWEASVTSLIAVSCLNYLLCPSGAHLDGVGSAELGGPCHLRNHRADRQPALHSRAGPGEGGSTAADGGPEALRIEPPDSAARSTPDDRAADCVAHSGDLPDGIRGLVRRHAGAPGCDRFAGQTISNSSRAARISRTARWKAETGTRGHMCCGWGRSRSERSPSRGPELDRLTIVAVASLTAIALERARSFEKESRAEAAHQTEQLRTAVLDALAHAFKTPLTAILTASSGLLETRAPHDG